MSSAAHCLNRRWLQNSFLAASIGLLSLAVLAAPADAQSKKKGEPTPAAAPAPAAPAEEPDAWAVGCNIQGSQKFVCEMNQNIVDQKSRAQVMLISIKNATGGGSPVMLFRVLHGVYLPAGVTVAIDKGQPATAHFQKSDQLGAYAALPLDEKWIADMKKGKELLVGFQVNQGEALNIVARLNGFGRSLDKIRSIN